jgi:hypothetical protein
MLKCSIACKVFAAQTQKTQNISWLCGASADQPKIYFLQICLSSYKLYIHLCYMVFECFSFSAFSEDICYRVGT